MKKIIALLAALVLVAGTYAQNYTPVADSSTVAFTIKNLGFNVHGHFSGLKGKITFDPGHPEHCSFDMVLDVNTIDTDNNMRDNHLRSEDFFDVKNYPHITFVSTKVTKGKAGTFFMEGNLTIRKI